MSRFLSNYSDSTITLIGFWIFFILFIVLVWRIYSKANAPMYDQLSRLPFESDLNQTTENKNKAKENSHVE